MPKPSVLHVINNLNVSGATILLLDVATRLRPEPGSLAICTLETENPMGDALARTGARVLAPGSKLGLASGIRWVCRAIRQTRPDIVHTHLLPATQVGLAAAKLMNKPVVTTVHFTFERLSASGLLRRVNRTSFKFYRHILAISEAVKKSILDSCAVPPGRVMVLRSGVDFARTSDPSLELRRDIRRRFAIADDELLIGSIGRLEEVKDYRLLIRATQRVRANHSSVRLMLAGDGSQRRSLEREVAETGLGDRVIFAGTQKEPAGFLAAFDIFALPSLHEGLGLSIIEAMGAGLPVIGSTAGGIPEVVSDARSGLLFEAGNSAALADCLDRLIRSPELRRRLGEAGKAEVEQEFDIARYVERLYEEYETMLPAGEKAELAETAT